MRDGARDCIALFSYQIDLSLTKNTPDARLQRPNDASECYPVAVIYEFVRAIVYHKMLFFASSFWKIKNIKGSKKGKIRENEANGGYIL